MKVHSQLPLPRNEFFAAANPGRCRARVLTDEHYARYVRALEHAVAAEEAGRGFYRQELGGAPPDAGCPCPWPRAVSRWAVYVSPVTRVVVQVIDRKKIKPGDEYPPAYKGGPSYHADVKIARACRAALDQSRGRRYATRPA